MNCGICLLDMCLCIMALTPTKVVTLPTKCQQAIDKICAYHGVGASRAITKLNYCSICRGRRSFVANNNRQCRHTATWRDYSRPSLDSQVIRRGNVAGIVFSKSACAISACNRSSTLCAHRELARAPFRHQISPCASCAKHESYGQHGRARYSFNYPFHVFPFLCLFVKWWVGGKGRVARMRW